MSAAQKIFVDGKNVVPDVWEVLDKIKDFSDKVRRTAEGRDSGATCHFIVGACVCRQLVLLRACTRRLAARERAVCMVGVVVCRCGRAIGRA